MAKKRKGASSHGPVKRPRIEETKPPSHTASATPAKTLRAAPDVLRRSARIQDQRVEVKNKSSVTSRTTKEAKADHAPLDMRSQAELKQQRNDYMKKSSHTSGTIKKNKSSKRACDANVTLWLARVKQRSTNQKKETSRFLALSAELRIPIYEYALTDDNEYILITPDLKLPSLLHTSRQVRAETCKIWFRDANKFMLTIIDCDATLLCTFMRTIRSIPSIVTMFYRTSLEGSKNWANLVRWCRAVWQDGETGAPLTGSLFDEYDGHLAGIAGAVETAVQHRTRSWEECEKALSTLRSVVGKLDPDWLT